MTGTDDEAGERPSKSARKRESQELQELGEELIGLPDTVFDAVELPETLREAILAARRIKAHGALLRQRQYIGRLMRTIDATPIRAVIDQHLTRQRSSGARFRQVEGWRDRLVTEGASAIPALQAVAATADSAEVAKLLEAVRHAHDDHTRRTASRALFRYLDGKWGHS
ncbi:MAG TPA: ribosome biogenesis factor YjgA [Steroidobacteraceae bacterium]|nr:ribosome biogenesis factor YjgA [Steroidobacteraceae bacterium]